jgi:ATP-binding cassette subfamily C protein
MQRARSNHVSHLEPEDVKKSLSIVKERLRGILSEDEHAPYFFMSDLNEEGRYDVRWLVVGDRRLFVFSGSGSLEKEIRIGDISSVWFRDYIGSAEIGVCVDDSFESLIRFRRNRAEDFRKAATLIEEIKNGLDLALNIRPDSEFIYAGVQNQFGRRETLSWLLSFLRPHWPHMLLGLLLSIGITGLSLVPPILMRSLIDNALGAEKDIQLLVTLAIYLITIYAFSTLLNIGQQYLLAHIGRQVIFSMRKSLYAHIQRLSLSFYDRMSSGRILSRILDDVGRVQWFLAWGIPSLVVNALLLVGVGIILFTINLRLAALALIPVTFTALGVPRFRRRARKAYHKSWRRWSDVSSLLVDTISGAITVKSFAREDSEIERLEEKLRRLIQSDKEITVLHLQFFPLLGFLASLGAVMVWWFGGLAVVGGELSLGTLVAFVNYMWMFYNPVNSITNLIQPLQQALTSGERVLEVMTVESDVKEDPNALELEIKGNMKFVDVTFGYEPYIPVVHKINLEIKAGEMVGIVGPSGSGKTTLVKLIMRHYDPIEGRIEIDGVDVKRLRLDALRRQIGVVQQEPILFDDSVLFNISYGKPEAQPEEIIAAAKAANAHQFIMNLPLAYDSPVGERGSRLSGGERQRVAIARAILTNPKILILDEATSSVDTITERQIQEAMDRLVKNRTTIVIAHRLSTLQNADRIVVMDKGKIVETGTHEELLKSGGLYAQLYQAQFAEEAGLKAVQEAR